MSQSEPVQPSRRLHASTLAVAFTVSGIVVLLNVPGDRDWREVPRHPEVIRHGWPYTYLARRNYLSGLLTRELSVWPIPPLAPTLLPAFRSPVERNRDVDQLLAHLGYAREAAVRFSPAKLAIDVLVGLILVGASAIGYELWRRSRPNYLQLSVRSFLLVTVLLAAIFGYWKKRDEQRSKRQQAIQVLQGLGAVVCVEPGAPDWLCDLFGRDLLPAFAAPKSCDSGIGRLIFHEAYPFVRRDSSKIGDRELWLIRSWTSLECLDLSGTQVTDAGLNSLELLSNLKHLSLRNVQIGNAGLVHLRGLTELVELELTNTKVDEEGVRRIQAALPSCRIRR